MPVRFFRKLWSRRSAPPPPVLLRVAEPTGAAAARLDIELLWLPCDRRAERDVFTADGLCVLPWRADEDRVEIVVRSALGRSELVVERSSNDGAVIEIELVRELAAPAQSPRGTRSSSAM